jgi:outer membrane protein
VKSKKEEGMASSYDVLRAEVDVSNFKAKMIKEQNQISRSTTHLLKLLGASEESSLHLKDSLTYEPWTIGVEEATQAAFEHRPDLYMANLAVEMQKEAVKVARSKYYPKIDAIFDQQWGRPDPHYPTCYSWGTGWQAQIAFTWDLFDVGRKSGKLLQEKATLDQKKLLLKDKEESIVLEVEQTLLTLQDAEQLVQSQALDLERAQEGLKLAEVGYKEGVKTEVEVADALSAMTASQSLYYQSIYKHTLAKLQVKLAMGIVTIEERER